MVTFNDLPSYLNFLERQGDLCHIKVEVDPELEITEIVTRVVKAGGPALLFERVKGSPYPLAINLFGSDKRMEWILGRHPLEIGEELAGFVTAVNPPSLGAFWTERNVIKRLLNMRTKKLTGDGGLETLEEPNLSSLPILKCWPKDGGRFITLPLVMSQDPLSGKRNTAFYRMQMFENNLAGMHWQIERGGRAHYEESKAGNKNLSVSVALGCDPATIFAAAVPLPENWDELAFAGYLRGNPVPLVRPEGSSMYVPANAEFVLEGVVPLNETKLEGPFGDHLGHYSLAADFPVFRVKRMLRKRNPVYPATVVGKPPQEDKFIGEAIQYIFKPLLKMMHPEIADIWAYYEAGFHNLLVVSIKQRYEKECIKTALSLLGQGQLSLTKCLILVDADVKPGNFMDVLGAIESNFDPAEDLALLHGTSGDTLDFTSGKINFGSKMIIDATKERHKGTEAQRHKENNTAVIANLPLVIANRVKQSHALGLLHSVRNDGGETRNDTLQNYPISGYKQFGNAMLVVQTKSNGRSLIKKLVQDKALAGLKLIVAVSDDISLDDNTRLIWGIFTRFDCSRDLVFARAAMEGIKPVYRGPMGIDATWKTGYPDPVEMSPEVIALVNKRWRDYKIEI